MRPLNVLVIPEDDSRHSPHFLKEDLHSRTFQIYCAQLLQISSCCILNHLGYSVVAIYEGFFNIISICSLLILLRYNCFIEQEKVFSSCNWIYYNFSCIFLINWALDFTRIFCLVNEIVQRVMTSQAIASKMTAMVYVIRFLSIRT